MNEINIAVEVGTSKRLLTAGKYCDRDIVVTAEGGTVETWTFEMEDGSTVKKDVVVQ